MILKPKYVWYCGVAIFGALAWFDIFSWPHDSAAAMNWLSAIDQRIFRPAAHPTMFALVVGLAIGTILLPEIWRVTRDYAFPAEARPDWDLREAVDYLRVQSKWAIGRIYYANERLLEEDIDEVLRDAASQGRISIWGRPAQTGVAALFSRGTEMKIPVSDLQSMSLDLTTIDDGTAPSGAVLRAYSQDQYCFLRVSHKEIHREWPSALCARLVFDKTWRSRRLRIIPVIAETHETP
jgi:hypothetical protein